MKTLAIISLLFLASCAEEGVGEVKSGDVKHIPYTTNLIIGTDSTLIIIDRKTGATINKIKRH